MNLNNIFSFSWKYVRPWVFTITGRDVATELWLVNGMMKIAVIYHRRHLMFAITAMDRFNIIWLYGTAGSMQKGTRAIHIQDNDIVCKMQNWPASLLVHFLDRRLF